MRIHRRTSPISIAFTVALLTACAPAPGPAGAAPSQDRDVITRSELADGRIAGGTVLEAVRKLRPRFLNRVGTPVLGQTAPSAAKAQDPVMASINGAPPIAIEELGRMSVSEVTEIRYLSVADAGFRFGLSGNNSPVLLVTLTPR